MNLFFACLIGLFKIKYVHSIDVLLFGDGLLNPQKIFPVRFFYLQFINNGVK